LREFLTGVDSESLVDVAEVVFDGLRAEEQGGGGFPRGSPTGKQQRNLELRRIALTPKPTSRSSMLFLEAQATAFPPCSA
jgi:hypothetical protein